jgi:hypothetical protein
MRRVHVVLLIALLVSPFACSDDDPAAPEHVPEDIDVLINSLGDTLAALQDMDEEALRNADFSALRNGFQKHVNVPERAAKAHLGLSILSLLELNYNAQIWGIVDDLRAFSQGGSAVQPNRHRTVIGRQFELMVEMPFGFYSRLAMRGMSADISLARIQDVIKTVVIPGLDNAISHIEATEQHTDTEIRIPVVVWGDFDTDTVTIDLGEIYVFSAGLYALRSCFKSLIAYNLDLYGPNGTYDWIHDLDNLETPLPCPVYTVNEDTLDLHYPAYIDYWFGGGDAREDSIVLSVLHHNLTSTSSEFLELRDNDALPGARSDLLGVVTKLESSVNFIRNIRTGETEENVIKLTDLTGLDSDISGNGDEPNFMDDWTSIEDVLDFVQDLYGDDPLSFSEIIGDTLPTLFEWDLHLKKLYDPGIADWKTMLPYHEWGLPSVGRWLVCENRLVWLYDTWGGEWYAWVLENGSCVERSFSNINWVRESATVCELPVGSYLWLTDEGGNPIVVGDDPGEERFPYFVDYTFGGLFPDMDRDRWILLVEILGDEFGGGSGPVSPPLTGLSAQRR